MTKNVQLKILDNPRADSPFLKVLLETDPTLSRNGGGICPQCPSNQSSPVSNGPTQESVDEIDIRVDSRTHATAIQLVLSTVAVDYAGTIEVWISSRGNLTDKAALWFWFSDPE